MVNMHPIRRTRTSGNCKCKGRRQGSDALFRLAMFPTVYVFYCFLFLNVHFGSRIMSNVLGNVFWYFKYAFLQIMFCNNHDNYVIRLDVMGAQLAIRYLFRPYNANNTARIRRQGNLYDFDDVRVLFV